MLFKDRLKYFKEDFVTQLKQKENEVALSFYNRCNDHNFNAEKELQALRVAQEATAVSLSIFDSTYENVLGGELQEINNA